MKKSKIALKLSFNFAAALLLFSFIIGSVFLVLFKNYTVEVHKNELQNYAESLAKALSDEGTDGFGNHMGGYGAYLRFIGEIANTDVWIVDENLNLLTVGKGNKMMNGRYNFTDLPENASELIDEVLQGETTFSKDFSNILSQPTLTVGAPIKNENGGIWGVVLLHSSVEGSADAVNRGLGILGISIVLALAVTSILSIILSYSFTRPLSRMKQVALRLSQGDYFVQCGINREDEIGELSDILDLLAARLKEASRQSEKLEQLRRDFVANISHELRTPITVMRGSLEALHEKVVTEPQKVEEYYIQMIDEARFLERLVGDLLDLSRLQNADFIVNLSPVILCDVLSDAARSAKQLAQEKQIEIQTEMPEPCMCIQGDYGRLRQMFLIILDNAIKFSPENTAVHISVIGQRVLIRDHGPGIELQHIPHIFERFYKAQGTQNKSGTGLGLAIAKQIAERHNIKLSVVNHSDGGAEFTFELPMS
ncbi:sensor histidine kinase [Sinanaerobacter sp. ZZT-01]|uniref:sensor histidine kinase n=1 Tax=Sinanaerobacter sp. ZZT-01 TaxID=3111540 RepID=UPI002D77C56B|nr:ATP-binding protein [Sinanaerobacter sp. ZZT-01]WRR94324.1 ATP-binding protein [Sinanaerobacter sp. ZZT-01]